MSKPTPHVPISAEELSAEELALLGRVRRQLREESVPANVRQRLLYRVLDDVSRAEPGRVVPAAQLVPVQGGLLGSAMWWIAAAAALGLVLLVNRSLGFFGGATEPPSVAADSRARGAASGALGERLLRMSIFQAPAQTLSGSDVRNLPPASLSLFGEQPFSARSRAWQVRRWDDLQSDPVEPAQHDFEDGALCVALGAGERVLGGWPWLEARAPDAPDAVALVAGKSYRLAFKAWAREPLPAQLLIALGHARLPFSGRAGARVPLSTEPQPFVVDFVSSADDPSVGVAFLATGADVEERTRVCLSDVTLTER
jgi:hypothetical protein